MSHRTGKIKLIDKSIDEKHVNVNYPELKLKHKKVQHKINNLILQTIQTVIKEDSKEQNTFYGECKIKLNKENLLSLIFEMYCYSHEKNTSFNIFKSLTINTRTAYIYNLESIFKENSNYETILNRMILQNIRDNNIPIIDEFGNIGKNKNFYITEDSLVIYYNLLKNSTYASIYCVPQFTLTFDSIKTIINPKCPIAKLLRT